MIVRTYTNMWNEEKKLYTIYDMTLPTPISFKQIGLFFMGSILWMPLMGIVGVPIGNPVGFVSWFAPPVILSVVGNRKMFGGKSLFEFASSMIGFFFEPKIVLDGEGISANAECLQIEQEEIALSSKPIDLEVNEEDKKKIIKKETPNIDLVYKVWTHKPLQRN